ncbi:MAG TPA: PAS domain-containing protein, partial [Polyangiaceae bacterium]
MDAPRERGVLPLGVIRDDRLVFANERLADYLGYRASDLIGTRFLDHIAPSDRERVRDRHARRVRGESVPESYELVLVRKDGATRHAEVYVSFESPGDVVFELADRSHLASRREHLRALAGLGAAVQREQSEPQIFATLGDGLTALGMAWARLEVDGDALVVLDVGGSGESTERLEREAKIDVRGSRGPWTEPSRRAWRDGSAFIDDLPLMAGTFFGGGPGPLARTVAREAALNRGIALR